MNIFVLDRDPEEAAKMMCDKHVVKMVLESTQLLSNAFNQDVAPYKHTHVNHPCSMWVKESLQNWWWLHCHAMSLSEQYTKRYGKVHKCNQLLAKMFDMAKSGLLKIPVDSQINFAQCMPEQYKILANPVKAYRNYYIGEKAKFAKWEKGTEKPFWWI